MEISPVSAARRSPALSQHASRTLRKSSTSYSILMDFQGIFKLCSKLTLKIKINLLILKAVVWIAMLGFGAHSPPAS